MQVLAQALPGDDLLLTCGERTYLVDCRVFQHLTPGLIADALCNAIAIVQRVQPPAVLMQPATNKLFRSDGTAQRTQEKTAPSPGPVAVLPASQKFHTKIKNLNSNVPDVIREHFGQQNSNPSSRIAARSLAVDGAIDTTKTAPADSMFGVPQSQR